MRMTASNRAIVIPLLLLSALLASPVCAQKSLSDGVDDLAEKLAKSYGDVKKGRVAILSFRQLAGGENLLGTYLADTLTNSLFNVGYRSIVERQLLDQAVKEMKLQYKGMIDPESAKKIGKFLNADLVVGGTMSEQIGKVEVTCRMFATQTGEIVAVAKTDLLKDDNVKAMLGKEGSSAKDDGNGSHSIDSVGDSEASPSPGHVYDQTSQGLAFQLRSCILNGDVLFCDVGITAKKQDLWIYISGHSRLIDRTGAVIEPKMLMVGGQSNPIQIYLQLVRGIEITARMRFAGLDPDSKGIKLMELRFRGDDFSDGVVQFRDVLFD